MSADIASAIHPWLLGCHGWFTTSFLCGLCAPHSSVTACCFRWHQDVLVSNYQFFRHGFMCCFFCVVAARCRWRGTESSARSGECTSVPFLRLWEGKWKRQSEANISCSPITRITGDHRPRLKGVKEKTDCSEGHWANDRDCTMSFTSSSRQKATNSMLRTLRRRRRRHQFDCVPNEQTSAIAAGT